MSDRERVCAACNESWPADAEFYNGDSPRCHACVDERRPAASRRAYRTPEKERERQREKYLRHKDRYRERMRAWNAAHREERNARRRVKRKETDISGAQSV